MDPPKRLLVTGARGFVAGSVLWQAGPDWEVHAVSRGEPLTFRDRVQWHQFDPGDADRFTEWFREVQPEAVIHTAALADIDYCEAHAELGRKVNVTLTQMLASLCARHGARLVHCSTDTVFDGEHAPYREDDLPCPVNFYAETKAEAEKKVAESSAKAVIARLALVVGLPILGAGNSFLSRMVAALTAGREMGVPHNEIRTPIDVLTAGRALLELAAGPHEGIFHLAGNDSINRFEMVQRIAARFGLSPRLIVPQASASSPGRARRPRDVSLDNQKARTQLTTPLLSLDDALSLILQNQKQCSL